MVFSAILGLASAGLGFAQFAEQSRIAREELALKRRSLKNQEDMSMLNYGMGRDQLRREREQEAYLREINDENRRFAQREYAERQQQYQRRLDQTLREREYMIDRQVALDRDAAEQQQFMLEQYLENKSINEQERAFAVQQLEEAKAIAKGERDEDLRKRAREEQIAAIEREFAIEQMYSSQATAASERADDIAFRDEIIGRLDAMTGQIDAAFAGMPALTAPELLGTDEFNEILARFESNAIANVDRAADRVASINEASLMTRGIENSSIGTGERGRVASRLALDYENARQAAMQQALAYITGSNDVTMQQFNAIKDARGSRAAEITAMTAPVIEAMLNSRQVGSANDFTTPVPINSGIIDRAVRSANDFSAPVPIGSATERQSIGSRMAATLTPPSVADAYVFDLGSRAFNPNMWSITSPSSFFGTAAQLQSGVSQGYDPSTYFANARGYWGDAMSSLGFAAGEFQYGGSGYSPNRASAPPSQKSWMDNPPLPTLRPTTGPTFQTMNWPG